MFYFCWTVAEEEFNPLKHAKEEIQVFSLIIQQKETEFATAKVLIKDLAFSEKDHAFISFDDGQKTHLLFKGRRVGMPLLQESSLSQLELVAEPLKAYEKLQDILKHVKKEPYWDPLFVAKSKENDPAEILDAYPFLPHWDRFQKTVSLSSIFKGAYQLDLDNNTLVDDSLKMRFLSMPLSDIEVEIHCEWLQKAEGEINIAPLIASSFPGGIINTLTFHHLKKNWPQEGLKLGKSGYTVLKSTLEVITPPKTGILNIYPTLTPPFWLFNQQKPYQVYAQRFWCKATLILGWRYEQKRKETLTFSLRHKHQLDSIKRLKKIKIFLQTIDQIPDQSLRTSFFISARGQKALKHALEIAKCHLAISARCVEVEAIIPFNVGYTLSLDHTICLKNILGFKEIKGKVVEYRFVIEHVEQYVWFKIHCSIGTDEVSYSYKSDKSEKTQEYVENDYFVNDKTPWEDFSKQHPKEGIINFQTLNLYDFVKNISIDNHAEEQIDDITKEKYIQNLSLESYIKPTKISFDLLDIRTKNELYHSIKTIVKTPYYSPKQIF